jgi:hypothetical protein
VRPRVKYRLRLVIARFLLADKTNTIHLKYLLGEVLTDICALVDYFLDSFMCVTNINTLRRILTTVSSQFDPRVVVHPTGLYKQRQTSTLRHLHLH